MITHSPGPWRWDEKNDHGSPLIFDANGAPVAAFHQHDCDSEAWWEVQDADARLIAAAPELLQLVRDFMCENEPHMVGDLGPWRCPSCQKYWKKDGTEKHHPCCTWVDARALIARIEGRE